MRKSSSTEKVGVLCVLDGKYQVSGATSTVYMYIGSAQCELAIVKRGNLGNRLRNTLVRASAQITPKSGVKYM